jgi:hypothetical protein
MGDLGGGVPTDRARQALRLRTGELKMRTMFALYLTVIVAGLVSYSVIGLLHL